MRLGPAEGQDALDELGGAAHRPPHLVEVLLHRVRRSEIHRGELEVPADRREQIVEVVGDAAGERAHRLHLLRLPELRLEPLAGLFGPAPLGDVDGGADVAGEGAAGVDARDAVRRHPAILAVGAARAGIDLEGLPLLEGAEEDIGPDLPVVWVQEIVPAVGRHLVELPPEEGNPLLVDEIGLAEGVRGPHHHRRGIGQGAEALFALPQRRLGTLAVGDVDHDAAQRSRPCVDDVNGDAILQPDHPPVGRDHPIVELVVATGLGALDAVADRGVAVGRMDVRGPEVRVVHPDTHRVAEQPLGLLADEREAEGLRVGLPDDAVDGRDQLGQVFPRQPRRFVGLDAGSDVLDEEHDAADRSGRVVPGLDLPPQPGLRGVEKRLDPLALDARRLAGQTAPVRIAPVLGEVRVDVVVAAADEIDALRRVRGLPAAVDREIAQLAVQHRHRPGRVVEEELQPLLAVAQPLDLAGVLRLAVAHPRLRGPEVGRNAAGKGGLYGRNTAVG